MPKKVCQHCKTEMAEGATVCAACGRRSGISLGQVVGAAFVLLIAAVVVVVMWNYAVGRMS